MTSPEHAGDIEKKYAEREPHRQAIYEFLESCDQPPEFSEILIAIAPRLGIEPEAARLFTANPQASYAPETFRLSHNTQFALLDLSSEDKVTVLHALTDSDGQRTPKRYALTYKSNAKTLRQDLARTFGPDKRPANVPYETRLELGRLLVASGYRQRFSHAPAKGSSPTVKDMVEGFDKRVRRAGDIARMISQEDLVIGPYYSALDGVELCGKGIIIWGRDEKPSTNVA